MRMPWWQSDGVEGVRAQQTAFLLEQSCDVLLLTEVKVGWTLPGYSITEGGPDMGPGKRWAAGEMAASYRRCPRPRS